MNNTRYWWWTTFWVGSLLIAAAPSAFAQKVDDGGKLLADATKLQEKARTEKDFQNLVKKFEQTLRAFEKSKDMSNQQVVIQRLVAIFEKRGDLARACQYQEKWVDQAKAAGERSLHAEALRNVAEIYGKLGSYVQAAEAYQACCTLRNQLGDAKGEATAYLDLGNLQREAGRLADAQSAYRKALQIGSKIKDVDVDSDALNNLGTISILSGRYAEAIDHLEMAVSAAEQLGDPARQELILLNLGYAFRAIGRYSEAAACFEKGLLLVRQTQNPATELLLLGFLGELYQDWGFHSRAQDFFEQALALAANTGDKKAQALNLVRLAKTLEQKSEYEQALRRALEALKVARETGTGQQEAQEALGSIYLEMGRLAEAEPFVVKAGSAALLGRWYLARFDYDKAREQYERFLKASEETNVPDDLFTAHTGLGRVNEAVRDYNAAHEHYSRGMEVIEGLRSSLLPSARRSFLAVRVNGFGRLEPTKGLIRVLMKQGRWEESIVPSELGRARAFADRLALGPEHGYAGVPKDIQDEERDLVATLSALKNLRSCCSKKDDPKRHETLTREIDKAQKMFDDFVDMLWTDYRPYAAVKYPRPVKLDDLTLPADAYLVVFDLLGDGVGIKLLKGKELLASEYKEWDSRGLAKQVAAFRKSFETVKLQEFDPELGRTLYEGLLAGVLQKVPKGSHLTIIPDGVLAELPLEALTVEGTVMWAHSRWGSVPAGVTYLGDRYHVSYFHSLTTLALSQATLKAKGSPSVLVIADPVFESVDPRAQGLPDLELAAGDKQARINLMHDLEEETQAQLEFTRLPETGKMAENLVALYGEASSAYTGLKADKALFFSEVVPGIERYSYLIFATHGVYDTDIPGILEPMMALTTVPAGKDGFLRMTEVMSVKMDADLVALTACHTGLGKYLSGEGVMSMGRAFQYSGARSVLMTLWRVDETASVMLIESLFRHLKEGKSKHEALSLARSELRSKDFDHPFFWAPFILVGSN